MPVILNSTAGEYKYRSQVPKHEPDAPVHTFYPVIVAFFESEEGKREFREWKAGLQANNIADKLNT